MFEYTFGTVAAGLITKLTSFEMPLLLSCYFHCGLHYEH